MHMWSKEPLEADGANVHTHTKKSNKKIQHHKEKLHEAEITSDQKKLGKNPSSVIYIKIT